MLQDTTPKSEGEKASEHEEVILRPAPTLRITKILLYF